jgi:gluconokinase
MEARTGTRHVLVMGVCGSGKSFVGRALADALGATFVEGDAFHPEVNVAHMSAGKPLTDEMRAGWLDSIGEAAGRLPGRAVVACSALKEIYRTRLRGAMGDLLIIHLTGDPALLRDRVGGRSDHFMPASLLDSQISDLEPPSGAGVLEVDVAAPPKAVVARALTFIARADEGAGALP